MSRFKPVNSKDGMWPPETSHKYLGRNYKDIVTVLLCF